MRGEYLELIAEVTGKIGKKIGSEWYGHINAIDNNLANISPQYLEILNNARPYVPEDFEYDFISISPRGVRFLKMTSLEEPHPYVEQSIKVDREGRVTSGATRGQIYHRLETMVSPDHHTYDFHKAVTEWEEKQGLLNFDGKTPSGYYKRWLDQIKSKTGLEEDDLILKWNQLKKEYLKDTHEL